MKNASLLMILGSLCLLGLFAFPLWNIMLGAPQYPEPLGMNIHINGIKGVQEFDIQNIDGLNHYIGMKTIPKPEEMWEFQIFPLVVGSMVILGITIGVLGFFNKVGYSWYLVWFLVMSVLGIMGMYDFNAWLIDYGTNLDPKAIMKLTYPDGTPLTYKPPLFGHEKMLNFDVTSLPSTGAWMMFVGMMMTLTAFFMGWKKHRTQNSPAIGEIANA
ncbi:LPXTG cell wall anchor domain-containing protein [Arenibacter sp. GZD96]|uniref:LPXTG cell wall anchor domain-containing protein n=1 Tax=Aurantibrevibacter litoralis TaxID=3106030 RepID=UPI002AFE6C39|nr:LPXTG cell wall anchor domain-containing protein [Arenibacter sp. GZD-96]MEA1785225.1 LPXTG cell wall anchor domain-containing protein [Arenibacter sp. GZD-96]